MKQSYAAVLTTLVVLALVPYASAESAKSKGPTDAQIKQLLIDESIAAYSGNCPCPYSTMANGRRCGRRSAHSRPGGEAPLCYPTDVTAEMVKAYREAHSFPGGGGTRRPPRPK